MRYLIIVLAIFIITCGGGGGGGPTEPEGPTGPSAPTVEDILLTTNEDVPSVIDLEGSDPGNLPLTFTITSQPSNGSFVLSGNAGTYTPNANYNGTDELKYIASNGSKSSNIGTVTITVNAVNDDPESIDVSVSINEDNSIDITLEANEYDGDEIVFQIDEQVSNGTLSLSGNIASYTPNTNWYGVDTFKFSVYDASARSILKSGNGTIVVNAVNDPPNVNDIYDIEVAMGTVKPVKLNASDVDSYSVSFEIVDSPSNGTVTVSNDTAYFSPLFTGSDSFTFQAYDGTDYSSVGSVFLDISQGTYDGINLAAFANEVKNLNNYFINGTTIATTLLNNGNELIGFAAFYNDNGTSYEPIHLIEINSIGQAVNRVSLSDLSVSASEVLALKQLSNGDIILVSALTTDSIVLNTYIHKLSSSYTIISEDLSPNNRHTGVRGSKTVNQNPIIELSNGGIFFDGYLYDSSLNDVGTKIGDRPLYHNDLLHTPSTETTTGNNNIVVTDLNGNTVNTITYDTNRNQVLHMLQKTSYGFIGFGYDQTSPQTVRFDENFNVLSYASNYSNVQNFHVFDEDENGFVIVGDGWYTSAFYRFDENGNLLLNKNIEYGYDTILRSENGNFVTFTLNNPGNGDPLNNNQVKNGDGSGKGRNIYLRKITPQGNRINE